jgi:hypothetical protein
MNQTNNSKINKMLKENKNDVHLVFHKSAIYEEIYIIMAVCNNEFV